jgi:hypothetical protein
LDGSGNPAYPYLHTVYRAIIKNKYIMARINIFTLIILTLLLCCEKNNNKVSKIEFKNITYRDIYGAIAGQTDTTDWRFDDRWLSKENELFTSTLLIKSCDHNDNFKIYAYPNPCEGIFNIHIEKDENSILLYRLVDSDFNIIISSDSTTIYRLYYQLLNINNECIYKGHGDIMINK